MAGAQARSRTAHSRMTLPSPYTAALVDKAFRGIPNGLHFESLARAFQSQHGKASPETATRRGGVRSTLFLIGIDGNALLTASVMSPEESKTAAGRAAWRRHRRLAWYLWQGMRHRRSDTGPLLLLAELDDVSDGEISDGVRGLPKLSSSSGKCGLKIAVPILLKGFGTTDLEKWYASSRSAAQLAKHATPPWHERVAAGVWRGSSRSVLPEETCSAVPDFTKWENHPRGKLVSLAALHPSVINAGYTELEKLPGGNTTPVALSRPLRWDDLRRFKYQIEVDGHGYQASLLAKMLLGSVVVTQRSHWRLWFQDALESGVHAVRTRSDLSDLPEKLGWLRSNDQRAQAIARRGNALARALLDPDNLVAHMAALLERYRTLFLDEPPQLDALFHSLCSSGERSCSVYNRSAPPPRFARISEHRHGNPRASGSFASGRLGGTVGTERIRCPTPHFADASLLRCDRWCERRQHREHCTWCKCGSCDFCGGKVGSAEIEVPRGFVVA